MTLLGFKRTLFGSTPRRLISLAVANLAFFGGGWLIQKYIEEQASSPGLSFVGVALWMALGVLAALVTVISLGEVLLYRGFSQRFLQDDLAQLDRRLARAEAGEEGGDDEDEAPMSYSPYRAGFLFVALAIANLLISNHLGGRFLQWYTHPGVAIVHLRSADPTVRRTGLTSLTERLEFQATPAVTRAVLPILDDPDEGVKARAAFVIGTLGIDEGAEPLAKLAIENEAMTFAALIALGQIRTDGARKALLGIMNHPVALKEPKALAMALAVAKAPAVERLQALYQSPDPETRAAALWGLGQLREPRLLSFVAPALEDPELMVRCAAADALLQMAVFEASPHLRRAFEAVKDPLTQCPEVRVPVQEGGPILRVVALRNFQLLLVRALHTTDDPELLKWYVTHQEGLEHETHELMRQSWENLKAKDAEGKLNHLKKKVQLMKLREGGLPGVPGAPGSVAPGSVAPESAAPVAPGSQAPGSVAPAAPGSAVPASAAPAAPGSAAPASAAPTSGAAAPAAPESAAFIYFQF